MEMTYKVLLHEEQYLEIYDLMREQNLLWAAWPEYGLEEWTPELFVEKFGSKHHLVLGGYIDGALAGAMTLLPGGERSMTAWIGLTAFRPFFPQAQELCRGALEWACDTQELASILGRVAAPNRHILRMLSSLGFAEVGRVPGMFWHARLRRFVTGVLVMATPQTIRQSKEVKLMSFGSGYDAPEVVSTPEKQATKSVTASATAAAANQREKASRNRGLAASILTTRSSGNGLASTDTSGKSTLG